MSTMSTSDHYRAKSIFSNKKKSHPSDSRNPHRPSSSMAKPQPVDTVEEYRVFDYKSTALYRIPSSLVQYTKGSDKYVRHDRTPNWQKKQIAEEQNNGKPTIFHLCNTFLTTKHCSRAANCKYIHASIEQDMDKVEITPVHNKEMKGEMLPAGVIIPIHDRVAGVVQGIDSELVLRTKGSVDWFESDPANRRRVYHCKHFHEEGICIRGPECVFLHALDRSLCVANDGTVLCVLASMSDEATPQRHRDFLDEDHCSTSKVPSGHSSLNGSAVCTFLNTNHLTVKSAHSRSNSGSGLDLHVKERRRSSSSSLEMSTPILHSYTHNPYEDVVLAPEGYLYIKM